jgi:hypothetical protein
METKQTLKKPVQANKVDADVTLADICESLKMEPSVARRVLRNARMKVNGGRWTWTKSSADIAKVTKLLKDSHAK